MKRYAVALINFFDNINKVFIVEAINPVEAIKSALIKFQGEKYQEDTRVWINSWMDEMSIEDVQRELFNSDISVSDPIEI